MKRVVFSAIVVLLAWSSVGLAQAKNLIFYGNSFTIATGFGSTRTVPAVLSDIAVAAGNPAPFMSNPSIAGWSLQQHRNSNTSAITTSIPLGQKWDYVILQDFSTQPTRLGNTATHRSSFLSLYNVVRTHSPNAKAIGYETWARGPGHSYYAGGSPTYPGGPAEMQAEVRNGYNLSTADVNAAHGAGTSIVSPVGDAWENAGFPLTLYASDIYHAQNRGTFLAALTLYTTIYGDNTVTDINLAGVLTSLNISASDGAVLASVVEATVPEPSAGMLLLAGATVLLRRR
ncbi:MAG TPA: PEP-CTERM sorting domain-containing protein [Tepidisphaeraceae bacterium]|nr:PEP-CTERM sorting domain-containing protein [Tepidisphaeraceae bacterium]